MLTIFRLVRIILISLRYRLDELVLSSIRYPLAYRLLWLVRLGRKPKLARGVRLRLALESLGPIFIKFGQVLSTRRDLIPLDVAQELALLQDRVKPFQSEQSAACIHATLGASHHPRFETFNHE